jgi:iron complex outermembrane receptor protein
VLGLSLEELMQITVTSVFKKAQHLAETAAAVFVIKADDIRRSGATSIPEALRLAGRASGRYRPEQMVGQHSRLQFLLRQQAAGASEWPRHLQSRLLRRVLGTQRHPPENIERIEVIRGPGGSLWGANAVNGIINILTYSAKDTQGGLLSAATGDELKGMGVARYGWVLDDETYLRLHASGKSVDGGEAVDGGDGPDYWKSKQAGVRLGTKREGDSHSLQGRLSDYEAGDSITGFTPGIPYFNTVNTDGAGKTAHLLGKWERPSPVRQTGVAAWASGSRPGDPAALPRPIKRMA